LNEVSCQKACERLQADERIKDVGAAIFKNLFTAHPEALALFPFRNPDGSVDTARLRARSPGAFSALGDAIAGLDDAEAVVAQLKELVRCAPHARKRCTELHVQTAALQPSAGRTRALRCCARASQKRWCINSWCGYRGHFKYGVKAEHCVLLTDAVAATLQQALGARWDAFIATWWPLSRPSTPRVRTGAAR
jgi:Globin